MDNIDWLQLVDGVEVRRSRHNPVGQPYEVVELEDGRIITYDTKEDYDKALQAQRDYLEKQREERHQEFLKQPIDKDLYTIYGYLDDGDVFIDVRYLDNSNTRYDIIKEIEEKKGHKVNHLSLQSMTEYTD